MNDPPLVAWRKMGLSQNFRENHQNFWGSIIVFRIKGPLHTSRHYFRTIQMTVFHFYASFLEGISHTKNLSVQSNQRCCRGCRTTLERIERFWKMFGRFICFQQENMQQNGIINAWSQTMAWFPLKLINLYASFHLKIYRISKRQFVLAG